jgi:hypothetical protein
MTRKKFSKGKRFELILKGQSLKIIDTLSEGARSQFIREAIQHYSEYLKRKEVLRT